jgi:hypothetical protein
MTVANEASMVIVDPSPRIEWPAIFAGSVVAAGISLTLLAFGSAIGLSVVSTAPTWRDSSPWLWLLSGIFLLFVALCGFGFGGYVAGRMRAPLTSRTTEEIEFGDGMHGILTWGLAILITAMLAVGGASTLVPAAAPSGSRIGPATSVAAESIIASELDELFRSDRRALDAENLAYRRSEAGRILLKSSSHLGVTGDDRDYLAAIAASQTGLTPADAVARADRAIAQSALEIRRARQAGVLQAFMIAAAMMVGAAVAWFAAREGGNEREHGWVPRWNWSPRRRLV